MANYNSSYTGAQIDAAVAKASAIPDPTGHLNTVLTHKTTGESWEKVGAAQMTAGTATNGQILIAGDDATVAWGDIPAPAGTSVTSTGATSGQVLTADGNGGASWQAGSGGGSKYIHRLKLTRVNDLQGLVYATIISPSATPLATLEDITTAVNSYGVIAASGSFSFNSPDASSGYMGLIVTNLYIYDSVLKIQGITTYRDVNTAGEGHLWLGNNYLYYQAKDVTSLPNVSDTVTQL